MQAVVIGGSGGIGGAFVAHLADQTHYELIATYRSKVPEGSLSEAAQWHPLDVEDAEQIGEFCAQLGEVGLFINAVGMLHTASQGPEKSLRQIDPEFFLQSIRINTLPTLLFAQHLPKHFRHQQPAVFATVSARVGSIEENHLGGWYSYRASKAALNQALKTTAIEWQRNLRNVCVAALHPGTTDTALSRPFQRNVPAEQLFTPQHSVTCMMNVIERLTPEKTGRFWSFDGEILPW